MATATTGSGGYSMVGSTATILAGTNSSGSAQTVSMAVADPDAGGADKPGADQRRGASERHGADGSSGQTSSVRAANGLRSRPCCRGAGSEGLLGVQRVDLSGLAEPEYGPMGERHRRQFRHQHRQFPSWGLGSDGDMTLGDWGVNTANDTVWAVVNHNSDFAVVPEPSTLALLAAGPRPCRLRMAAAGAKRPTSQRHDQQDAPPSSPSRRIRPANAARRAA